MVILNMARMPPPSSDLDMTAAGAKTAETQACEAAMMSHHDGAQSDQNGNTFFLSVVVSVNKEEGDIAEFLRRVQPKMVMQLSRFEIIFAPDRTEGVILEHGNFDDRIKLLRFARRVGHPMATVAGMAYSCGDAVVVIDVDLQDPLELIDQMVAKRKEGFDVVLAHRLNRKDKTWIKRVVSYLGYKFMNFGFLPSDRSVCNL